MSRSSPKQDADSLGPAGDRGLGRASESGSKFFEAVGKLDIGVFVDDDGPGRGLVRDLQRTRARVEHIWPCPEQIPSTFDVVYCVATKDLPQRLPWTLGYPESALVLVLEPSQPADISLIENCAPHAAVHLPIAPQAALSSLIMARSLFRYERRLRRRIEKLDENLRTMRSVERAKMILMHDKGLSEEEAYNYLRKKAMDRRATIGALATAIVDSQELLG